MVQLYFENQQAALCAVHTINTLLQGPYMDEIVLSEIALKLDEEERKLLGGTGFTGVNEYNNVRADGMFSSQVIFRALESVGLEPIPITNPAMRHVAQSPETEFAFILNSNEHWYTLRRVDDGTWWNFNSLNPAPEPISDFYLSAYIAQMQAEDWTVYVVRGAPRPGVPAMAAQQTGGRWFTPEEAVRLTKEKEEARQRGFAANMFSTLMGLADQGKVISSKAKDLLFGPDGEALAPQDDEDLQAAIAASLHGGGGGGGGGGAGPSGGLSYAAAARGGGGGRAVSVEDEDPELAQAILASLQGGSPSGSRLAPILASPAAPRRAAEEDAAEEEMRRAIALSLQAVDLPEGAAPRSGGREGSLSHVVEVQDDSPARRDRTATPAAAAAVAAVPEEPEQGEDGTLTLVLRFVGATNSAGLTRVQRRFRTSDTVGDVLRYARGAAGVAARAGARLVRQFPRRVWAEGEEGVALGEGGVADKEALAVEFTYT